MRMRVISFTVSALAVAATAIVSIVTPIQTVEAAAATHSGTACRAANLNQAFDLKWDHMRVLNASTFKRWVVCPATIATELYWDGSTGVDIYGPSAGDIYAWFGSTASSSAEVYCIWREIPSNNEGTEVTNLGAATITADGALPDVSSATIDLSAFGFYDTNTVTCRMDPGTGINSYQIDYFQTL